MFNLNIRPRFQGYQQHIQSREQQRMGRQINGEYAEVDVAVITDWEKDPTNPRIIGFGGGDEDKAYFRAFRHRQDIGLYGIPDNELHLHDRGAYVLSQQLGLDIIPETDLVDLQTILKSKNIFHRVGTIVDEVKNGQDLEAISPETLLKRHPVDFERLPLDDFSRSLIELYLYTVIARDADKEERNIMYVSKDPEQGILKSIDNEASGSKSSFSLQFPRAFNQLFHGQPIPEEYRQRLQQFINHREEHKKALFPYYDEQTIQGMFTRAQKLLTTNRMTPVNQW